LLGEDRYAAIKLEKRIFSARFHYTRQTMLYDIFVHYPDLANTIGIYPKTDQSHGFAWHKPYEMFRDWQENTINSDVRIQNYISCCLLSSMGILIAFIAVCAPYGFFVLSWGHQV